MFSLLQWEDWDSEYLYLKLEILFHSPLLYSLLKSSIKNNIASSAAVKAFKIFGLSGGGSEEC